MYLDHDIIFGITFEEHLEMLEFFLCRLKEAGLKIKERSETPERFSKYQTIAGDIRTHWVLTQVY